MHVQNLMNSLWDIRIFLGSSTERITLYNSVKSSMKQEPEMSSNWTVHTVAVVCDAFLQCSQFYLTSQCAVVYVYFEHGAVYRQDSSKNI